jgi:hypothetical protein
MHIDTMAKRAKQVGFIATAITSAVTARFGWLQGEDLLTSIVYAAGLGLASFLVGYGLVFAWESYRRKLPAGVTIAAVFVFAIAVVVEVLSHVGANASARTHDISRAAEQTATYTDTRAELERARADLSTMKQTRAPATISADMASLETRPWFAQTASCANPGSYANSCRRYQALKGELAAAQARTALDQRIQKLAGQSATSTAGHSVAMAQTKAIASYATWSTNPGAEDQAKANMMITLILAAYFVSLGLVNLVAQAFDPEPSSGKEAATTAQVFDFPAKPATAAHDQAEWARGVLRAAGGKA